MYSRFTEEIRTCSSLIKIFCLKKFPNRSGRDSSKWLKSPNNWKNRTQVKNGRNVGYSTGRSQKNVCIYSKIFLTLVPLNTYPPTMFCREIFHHAHNLFHFWTLSVPHHISRMMRMLTSWITFTVGSLDFSTSIFNVTQFGWEVSRQIFYSTSDLVWEASIKSIIKIIITLPHCLILIK